MRDTKHKITILSILGTLLVTGLYSQSVTFRVEIDALSFESSPGVFTFIDRGNREDLSVYASAFYVPSVGYEDELTNEVYTNFQALQSIDNLIELRDHILGLDPSSIQPAAGPELFGVFQQDITENSGAGLSPLMVLTVGGTLETIGVGDFIAVVGSPFVTPALGTTTIGFDTGTNSWEDILVGSGGSVVALEVIPEPSTYAALFGLAVLGLALVRRRISK